MAYNPVQHASFHWKHPRTGSVDTKEFSEPMSRLQQLELINHWNHTSQGEFVYWID